MANHTNWLNISSMRGSSGQTRLTITASTNPDEIDKRAIIKAYNPENGASAETYVTLSSYAPYINVSPSIVGIPGSGGTYQFGIYANCSYVIAYPDMVTSYSSSAGTGNTNITFTVPSTSADTTLVGNIVLTDTSGQYSTLVRLEQYGSGVSITYSPSAVTIPFSGGSATFTVTANCVYSVNKGSGTWYSVSSNSGYTGQTVFTICANTVNTGDTNWTSSIDIVGPSGSVGTVSVTQENQGSTRINYTADTSTIAASGEVRTITIDATDFINSSITVTVVDAPEGVTAVYTQSSTTRGLITLTVPDNPGSPRDITVVVTGRRALSTTTASATIVFPQAEHITVPIPYTADTSTVAASGETRMITIDTTNLVESSITISVEGATGVSAYYDNGVITVIFPENTELAKNIDIGISADTLNRDKGIATVSYTQASGYFVLIETSYYVETTTAKTPILYSSGISQFASASLEDGTNVPLETGFTFPATGIQKIYYGLKNNYLAESTFGKYTAAGGTDHLKKYTNLCSIIIPEGVVSIGRGCFQGCNYLGYVNLPNTLTEIGDNAFYSAGNSGYNPEYSVQNYMSVNMPDSVTTIGKAAFFLSGLKEIHIPSGLTFIQSLAFGKTNLRSLYIPDTVTGIGMNNSTYGGAIDGNNSMVWLRLPSGITTYDANTRGSGQIRVYQSLQALVIPRLETTYNTDATANYRRFGYPFGSGGTLFYPEGGNYDIWFSSRSPYNGSLSDFNWQRSTFQNETEAIYTYDLLYTGDTSNVSPNGERRTFVFAESIGSSVTVTYNVTIDGIDVTDSVLTINNEQSITIDIPLNSTLNNRTIVITTRGTAYNGCLVGTATVTLLQTTLQAGQE